MRTSDVRSHFLSDLSWTQLLIRPERSLLQCALGPAVPILGDSVALGVLATLFDIVASDPAMAACPDDWMSTRDLAMHAGAPIGAGPVVLDAHLERSGRSGVVVTGTAYDANGVNDLEQLAGSIDRGVLSRIATGVITFARMPRTAAPHMDDYSPADWVGKLRTSNEVDPVTTDVYTRLQVQALDDRGTLDVDLSPYVMNAIGTVTGGAQAGLAQLAAQAALPGMVTSDLQLHYLSLVRTGPLRSVVDVVRDDATGGVATVRLIDAGDADRLVSLATVMLTPGSAGTPR